MTRSGRRRTNLHPQQRVAGSLIRGRMDTLTQGVSQQPEHLRREGQADEQINGWSSPVEGLAKRRPTVVEARLLPSEKTDIWAESMLVRSGERYLLLMWTDGSTGYLQITRNGADVDVDVHGTGLGTTTIDSKTTITFTNTSYGYAASNLLQAYALVNQGALGLLLNRGKTVAMDSTLSTAQANEALIFVQGVTFDITYTVTLDEGLGTALTATFSTPLATDSPNKLSTTDAAASLQATIDASANWVATQIGPVVHVRRDNNADFTIKVDDDRSNTLARGIKTTVEVFSDLPLKAKGGMVVKVESDPGSTEDDFWVKFVRSSGAADSFGDGVWQETVAPGVKFRLDSATMPLVIYRAAQDRFYVGPADGAARTLSGAPNYTFPAWGERTAGNEETVPTPSFVGRELRDHLIFRSRYAVAGGESVVLSETDDIFNFFADTSVQVLETDPIDVRASSESSVALQWLTPVGTSVLAFSDREQFLLRASDAEVLTPRSAVVDLVSKVEVSPEVRPRVAGPNVLFATENAGNVAFRETQAFESSTARLGLNLGGSQEITLANPKYLAGNVKWWDVGENLDYMVVMTDADPKTVYVYKYLWQLDGGRVLRQQASWSKWTFDGDVRWLRFYDNKLHIIQSYADGTFVSSLEVEDLDDPASPGVYLDRRLQYPAVGSTPGTVVTASYDSGTDTTTFTLPFTIRSTTDVVVAYDDMDNPGVLIGTADSGTTIACSVRGDFTGVDVTIGARYLFRYDFTRAYLPQGDQDRQRAIGTLDGRLQVACWTIHYADTGAFTAIVNRKNRMFDSRHVFAPRLLGVENNVLGEPGPVLRTGTMRVPVYSKNTDCRVSVENDTFLPVRLNGASWEGNYNDRARGVG